MLTDYGSDKEGSVGRFGIGRDGSVLPLVDRNFQYPVQTSISKCSILNSFGEETTVPAGRSPDLLSSEDRPTGTLASSPSELGILSSGIDICTGYRDL